MAGRADDLERASAQLNLVAVVKPVSNVKRLDRIRLRIEPGWQRSAELIRSKFGLRIILRSPSIGSGEIRIHAVNVGEPPIVPNVIVVCMRVHHAYGKLGQSCNYSLNIADAHAGVQQRGSATADDQIRNHFFQLMRFVDGKYATANLVHLKPWVRGWNALQLAVGRTGKFPAPLWLLSSQRQRHKD